MAVRNVVFTLPFSLEKAWQFMTDRQKTGCLFPGCKGVEILDDLDSLWTVKLSFGPFSKTFTMRGHTTEMKPRDHFSWSAGTDHITTAGTVSFRPLGPKETEVTYHLEVSASGPYALLHDGLIGETVSAMLATFVNNIKKNLESTPQS